jgi:hypothetical protein
MRHEVYEITQLLDWIKALVFALIILRQSFKGSSVYNTLTRSGELKFVTPLTHNGIHIHIDHDPSMATRDPCHICTITPEHVTAAKHQQQTALTDKEKHICAFIQHCDPKVPDIEDFICTLHDKEEFN